MNLAIIPARGGSKRLPRKNVKFFDGIPIIGHAINTAKQSMLFDKIIVSTDDDEIAAIAKTFGAEIPFMRSKELAADHTPTVPVIKDAIQKQKEFLTPQSLVAAIYPCTPLLLPNDLALAFKKMETCEANYVLPVCKFSSPPERALILNEEMKTQSINSKHAWTRTQDLPSTFFDAGQFYVGRPKTWLSDTELHNGSAAILLPAWRSIDIDTEEDWEFAEHLYFTLKARGGRDFS